MDFFGEINPDGTPGNAASASDASRHAELIDPGGQLVCQPHAVAVFGGGTEILSVNIAVIRCETGIPDSSMFRLLMVQGRRFFHPMTKASRADHRTVGTGQASCGYLVPSSMIVGII